MGFKHEGPLFLLHKVGRTEALPFANSKACNRRPMWRSTSLTTNLFPRGIWIHVSFLSKQIGLMQPQFLFSCFEILEIEEIVLFENFIGCKSIDVCIRPFPCPRKKALAICVQSHYSSSYVSCYLCSLDMNTWQFCIFSFDSSYCQIS